MPATDLLTLALLVGAVLLVTPVPGPLHGPGPRGRAHLPVARPRARRARHLPRRGHRSRPAEQGWRSYAVSLLVFSLVAIGWLYLVLRIQAGLPLNPTAAPNVPEDLALNTAVSFVTNTNWQNYSGEVAMSHLTQAVGLAVQNFVSAAVGIAVAIALIRGLVRRRADTIGNFWVDVTRSTLYVLAPDRVPGSARPRLAGRAADLRRPRHGDDAPGRAADHLSRTDRLAGGDQGAGHERRRHRQRQLGPPVREPDRPHELARAVPDPGDPVLADGHVRRPGRRPPPGLGDLRRHGGDLRLAAVGRRSSPSPRPTRCSPPGSTRRWATWRARRSASARPAAACGPP